MLIPKGNPLMTGTVVTPNNATHTTHRMLSKDLFCIYLGIEAGVPDEIHDPSLGIILTQIQFGGQHTIVIETDTSLSSNEVRLVFYIHNGHLLHVHSILI